MERIVRRIGLAGVIPLTLTAVVGGGALIALADGDGGESLPDGSSSTPLSRWPFLANLDEPSLRVEIGSVSAFGNADDYLQKLAGELGVSEEQLREAIKQTNLELLDEAVANGEIPEEAAAKIRAAIESGEPGPHFGGGFILPGEFPGKSIIGGIEGGIAPFAFGLPLGDKTQLSNFLGVTEEELRDGLNDGKTLAEVAEAHGKSREQVKEFLIGQHESRLKEAEDAGKLTDAQADELRSEFADHVDRMLDAQIRIHVDEGDSRPGFEERFESWRESGSRLFPAPSESQSSDSSNKGKTY